MTNDKLMEDIHKLRKFGYSWRLIAWKYRDIPLPFTSHVAFFRNYRKWYSKLSIWQRFKLRLKYGR